MSGNFSDGVSGHDPVARCGGVGQDGFIECREHAQLGFVDRFVPDGAQLLREIGQQAGVDALVQGCRECGCADFALRRGTRATSEWLATERMGQ
jgi:hypothetical protein